jgi:hypothetical protein
MGDFYMKTNMIQETIKRVLREETQGIEQFLIQVMETYPETEGFINNIESFIKNSNCKKIEVAMFKYPALGLAVHNGVLFNEVIFKQQLPDFLFIILRMCIRLAKQIYTNWVKPPSLLTLYF